MFQKHICPPWCTIQVYPLCISKTCQKQVSKRLKYIKWTTHWAQKSGLTLTFEQVTWKSIGIIYSLRATPASSLVLISEGVKRYWADKTVGSKEWFDLDLWTCDLKINRDHLLMEGSPCTKSGIDQVKGSKDIKILSGQDSGLKRVVWPWPLNMWPENQ